MKIEAVKIRHKQTGIELSGCIRDQERFCFYNSLLHLVLRDEEWEQVDPPPPPRWSNITERLVLSGDFTTLFDRNKEGNNKLTTAIAGTLLDRYRFKIVTIDGTTCPVTVLLLEVQE